MKHVLQLRLKKLWPLLFVAIFSISAISVDRLKSHVTWLSDPLREGRRAGSSGANSSAEYIAGRLKEAGYSIQMQDLVGNRRNVIGRFGDAAKYIVIGAHYDGQGTGFLSASDNAAGVAVLLELARELKDEKLPVSVVAVAFDDEEQGLNGSRYYVDHSPFPLENAVAALVMDTLGRSFMDNSAWTLFVLGTEYSKELAGVVQKRSRTEMLVAGTDLIGPRSDFAPFAVKKVPYLFFSNATHKDYHGSGDTPDRLEYTRLAQDAAVISQIAKDIARLTTKPQFLQDPIYPPTEADALERQFAVIEKERKDVGEAYRLMFADLRSRIRTDKSREAPQIAATALLAFATPRLSSYMLSFILGPFYESQGKREIAIAVYDEAIKWSEGDSKVELEKKVRGLRSGPNGLALLKPFSDSTMPQRSLTAHINDPE